MFTFVNLYYYMNYDQIFETYKELSLHGRYLPLAHIMPLLNNLPGVKIIGNSVLGKPVCGYKKGTGDIRILMWSQMHGNESTTTKALFDFFNLLNSESGLSRQL